MKKRLLPTLASLVLSACVTAGKPVSLPQAEKSDPRPNIVMIVADDLGYSDLGAFGGEIRTPNLDALAAKGLRLTDFRAMSSCSPTRSMLLSGTDNHTAGIGAMAEYIRFAPGTENLRGRWGYEGALSPRVATIAERLHEGGYFTTMVGKWHLGHGAEENPDARGFETSFALIQGGSNHFGGPLDFLDVENFQEDYTENGVPADIPADFYSSDFYTDRMIAQIDARPNDRPFFAYLAYTAPHWPLQAPEEDIERYRGRYDEGWGALAEERIARMKAIGLLPADLPPASFHHEQEDWGTLSPEEKKVEARKMEIYAAMVDRLDQNVGRLVQHLKETGQYENTVFIFLSDNGPAGETLSRLIPPDQVAASRAKFDNSYEAMGTSASRVFYGPNWALAASAPFRLYKGTMAEGGTRVAAFMTYPGLGRSGEFGRTFANIMDITPTLLDLASVPLENAVEDRLVAPVTGQSMLPYLSGANERVHDADQAIAFELHHQRAVRQGDWKLLWMPEPFGKAEWTLHDLTSDPGEQVDLSNKFPGQKARMIEAWEAFATEKQIP